MAGGLLLMKIGWRNLWRNPRRTLLTVLALSVVLALLLISSGLLDGSYEQAVADHVRIGAGHVVIQGRGYQATHSQDLLLPAWVIESTQESLRVTSRQHALRGASPRLLASGLLRSAANASSVSIVAVRPEAEQSLSLIPQRIVAGSYLHDGTPYGVVIGAELARRLAVRVGGKVVLLTQAAQSPDLEPGIGESGEIQSALFRVVGIFRTALHPVDTHVIHVPLSTVQALLGVSTQVTQVAIFLAQESDAPLLAGDLQARLAAAPAEVLTWRESLPWLAQFFWLSDAYNYITNGVLLAVVGLGVLNTLLMAVLERRDELAVCAALGLRPGQLAGLVVYESLVLTVVSLAPGLLLGLGIHHYFATAGLDLRWLSTSNFPKSWIVFDPIIHSRLDLGRIAWSAGVVLTMVAGLSLYPACKAARANLSAARRGL